MARKSTTRKTATPSSTPSRRRSNPVMSWSLKKSHSPNDVASKGFFENMLHSLRTTGKNALSTRQVYAHILETIVAKANELLEQDGYEVPPHLRRYRCAKQYGKYSRHAWFLFAKNNRFHDPVQTIESKQKKGSDSLRLSY